MYVWDLPLHRRHRVEVSTRLLGLSREPFSQSFRLLARLQQHAFDLALRKRAKEEPPEEVRYPGR